MNARTVHVTVLSLLILTMGGCFHPISRKHRQTAISHLSPETILRELETFEGKLVLMGGTIVGIKHREGKTLVGILQKPLSQYDGRPMERLAPERYFLVRYDGYKDPDIFRKGREITVAGTVLGKELIKVEGKDRIFLLLQDRETHL